MKKNFILVIVIVSVNLISQAQDTLVRTEMSWIYSNTEEPGWQEPGFDDSGWSQVIKLDSNCSPVCDIGGDHFGNISQLPYVAYLRNKFFVDYQPSLALMNTGEDDDVEIYINGSLAFIDDNHLAGEYFGIDVTSFIIPYDTNTIAVKHTDFYCCGYAFGLLIHTPDSIFDPLGFASTSSNVCEKFCIDFSDQSNNNATAWQWIFEGADPSLSNDQNPTNICYDLPGVYDVTLITTNANGVDTFFKPDYITVNATPPIPVITQAGYTLTSSAADFYQWQFNTVDIPGATNQSYDAMQTGYYTVVTSDVNGCASSTTLYVDITGIENLFSGRNISVYPNPTSGAFTIDLKLSDEENTKVKIEVLNLLGQIIISENTKLDKGKLQKVIQLSDAAAEGMYLVKVTIGDRVYMTQINIQK